MFKSFEFCLPTRPTSDPSSSDWLHEVKWDGYRLRLERDGDLVGLMTRGSPQDRAEAVCARGEAVTLGVDGISDFNALHSRKHDDEVQFFAYDILIGVPVPRRFGRQTNLRTRFMRLRNEIIRHLTTCCSFTWSSWTNLPSEFPPRRP
jgi:hypothetical protein